MKRMRLICAFVLLLAFLVTACAPQQPVSTDATPTPTAAPSVEPAVKLAVKKGIPNPKGNVDELYLITGDTLQGGKIELDQSLAALPGASSSAAKALKIFHFNDMHGNLMLKSAKGDTHSLAQMKKIVDTAKASAGDNTAMLWVSAGDDHIGTALDELLGTTVEEFIMSAPYKAYTAAGLDFAVPGNHEFDKMTPIFARMVKENAGFPVVSSNIFDSQYVLPTPLAAVAVVKGLRVGVIGLTNHQETRMKTMLDSTIHAEDPTASLDALIPALEPYCDVFVVLSHMGNESSSRYTMKQGDRALAEHTGKLTQKPAVFVGGHTHLAINAEGLEQDNVVNGVLVAQTGEYGGNLGEINIKLSGSKPEFSAKLHKIISGKVTTDGTPYESENDYDVDFQKTVLDPLYQILDEKLDMKMGYTENTPELSVELTSIDRYIGECAFANFYNDGLVARSVEFATGKVDFSVFNATGMTGMTPGVDITYRDLFNMFPYADTLLTVKITGRQILEILTNNAARVVRPEELLQNGGTLDPAAFIERGFLHFSSGIRYTIVLGETNDKNTVKDVTLNGEPIESVLDKEYNLVLSTYLAIGRGGWQGEPVGQGLPDSFIGWNMKEFCEQNALDSGLSYRNEFVDYILKDCGGVIGASTGVIKDGRVKIVQG